MLKVGPRLWKTGLAVALTLAVLRMTGLKYEVFGAIAAVMAVAPSANQSFRNAAELIGVNILGGVVGAAAAMLAGPNPFVIGAVVVGVLLMCQALNWQKVSGAAVTVTLFVMAPHPETAYAYWGWRLLSVVMGSVIGTAVNALIFRPEYWPATAEAIAAAGAELDRFVADVAGRLARPHGYTKAEILAGAARVERSIAEARACAGRLEGAEAGRRELAERAVKVLASLLERIQIIHKAALSAERLPDYPAAVAEVQAAVSALLNHRQALYAFVLGQAALAPDLAPRLLAIERSFESAMRLPAQPEEAEVCFRLYRMRSSVSYMANRLGRLHVAAAGAAAAAPRGRQPGPLPSSGRAGAGLVSGEY